MPSPFGSWPPPTTPVTSVFARIGAVVAAVGDYAASKITNDSSVSGATVKDALNALLAGGGAPVSSVFTRIGAVVATAGDYTSSQVTNASAVAGSTVSAALNTLAGAITAVSATVAALTSSSISNVSTAPGASVTLALNSLVSAINAANATIAALTSTSIANVSSVAGSSVTAALNALLAAIPSVPVSSVFARTGAIVATAGDYTSTQVTNASTVTGATVTLALNAARDPVLAPPTTPSADDEEFLTDPFDPATPGGARGWNIQLAAALGTPMTRDGGIDLTQAIASGHFRSEVRNSTLLIQICPGETVTIWRQFAAALNTAQLWFCGYGMQNEPGYAGVDWQPCSMQFYKDAAGIPDVNNRDIFRWQTFPQRTEVVTIVAGVAAAAVQQLQTIACWDGMCCRMDHSTTSGLNFSGFPFRRNLTIGGVTRSNAASLRFNAATDKYGITFRFEQFVSIDSIVSTGIFAVPFFRRVPEAGGWIAQN